MDIATAGPLRVRRTCIVDQLRAERTQTSRSSRSGRSSSRQTSRDEIMGRILDMQVEFQQQMRRVAVDIARLQKMPMEEDGRVGYRHHS